MAEKAPGNVASLPPGRAHAAWQAWLGALADDAEAALAAALTYEALAPADRDAWLDALDEDAPHIVTPRESIYAPLLLVEEDAGRRSRIAARCGTLPSRGAPRAYRGVRDDGLHVCVVVVPLWLRFVETLRCGYAPSTGFVFAEHDPLRSDDDVEHADHRGAELERADLAFVVEELAHTVLAAQRKGEALPAALMAFDHLFTPEHEAVATT
jgi:hypothetical protein